MSYCTRLPIAVLFWKSKERNHQTQRSLFYASDTDKFTPPKHNLLVFQVRTNKAQDQGLLGSQCHNFRDLEHSCSSLAAQLPTFLEDIAQTYPFYCSCYITKILKYYCPTSIILKAMVLEQDASSRSENLYFSCEKRG